MGKMYPVWPRNYQSGYGFYSIYIIANFNFKEGRMGWFQVDFSRKVQTSQPKN